MCIDCKLADLQPASEGMNLVVFVLKIGQTITRQRFDGQQIQVAEVQVADDSASMALLAFDGNLYL